MERVPVIVNINMFYLPAMAKINKISNFNILDTEELKINANICKAVIRSKLTLQVYKKQACLEFYIYYVKGQICNSMIVMNGCNSKKNHE